MCGVVAVLDPAGPGSLAPALQALAHRGPDGQGTWRQGPVALGHTRLALQGGPRGAQPIVTPAWTGVVNGELYNHAALGTEASDSAVLLRRLHDHGVGGLDAMRGAWAAVLWDGRTLTAVRDRFGIKPLYWCVDAGRLMLASEPGALLALGHPARWDAAAVGSLLTHQYLLPTQTVFQGIHTLEPGCWLRARPGERPQIGRWWTWQGRQVGAGPALGQVVRRAVAERCVADQPVACQLSGGLDSALIATLAAEHGVRTAYTVRFAGPPGWDESAPAAQIAAHAGLTHRVVQVDQPTLLADLDDAVVASGGPVINTHVAAKWALARAVRADGHAVLLSGEGADELFWGYDHLVGGGATSPATAGVHVAQGPTHDTAAVQRAWGHVPGWLAAKAGVGWRLSQVASVSPAGFGPLVDALGAPPWDHPVGAAAWSWARMCLAGSILERLCDPLEMAWGVEGRMPLLDVSVADAADRVPVDQRVVDGVGKAPLRALAEPLLPAGFARRAKHPFMGPPLTPDAALRERLLDGPALPWVDRARLEAALDDHPDPDVAWDPVWLTVLSGQALARGYGL